MAHAYDARMQPTTRDILATYEAFYHKEIVVVYGIYILLILLHINILVLYIIYIYIILLLIYIYITSV